MTYLIFQLLTAGAKKIFGMMWKVRSYLNASRAVSNLDDSKFEVTCCVS